MATGNANYDRLTTFAIEQTLEKIAKIVWGSQSPLLTYMQEKKINFNTGYTTAGSTMLLPVNFSDQTYSAAGVADASQLTPDNISYTVGFTPAIYNFSHYRDHLSITSSEKELIRGKESRGISILESKTRQLMNSFRIQMATDMAGTGADSRTALLGIQQVLSTSNTVGSINQSTDTYWAAGVTTGAGGFSLKLIDDEHDRIKSLYRPYSADLVLASYSATNNVYGKIRDQIANSELLVNPKDNKADYGFTFIKYLDMEIAEDPFLGTNNPGTMAILSSHSWYWAQLSDRPMLQWAPYLYPLTDAMIHTYNHWVGLGCDDPKSNSLVSGISA